MTFKVKLEKFEGPLYLLLQMIEKEEMEISEVSLANITDDFLEFIDKNKNIDSELLADFLIIATRLLYIKSKTILPEVEADEEEIDLADQLRMYKEFVEASQVIEGLIDKKRFTYGRTKMVIPKREGFQPPSNFSIDMLVSAFQSVIKRLEPFLALQRQNIEKVVSVQEKIEHIRDFLNTNRKIIFTDVAKGSTSRADVVVSFIAMLELIKQNIIKVHQKGVFDEITLHPKD